jgi:ABC-type transport system involved in cytochrome c biogenesis permease subunit
MTLMFLEGISRFCFGASYAVALALELAQTFWPRPALRGVALGFGAAGLFAHSLFLLWRQPSLALPYGSLLFLAWVLAVFYLYGTVNHRRLAWAVFVLPVVLGLIGLTAAYPAGERVNWLTGLAGDRFWGGVHGVLLLMAAVGASVGALASVMYLVQQQRLQAKVAPGQGLRLLSLERLETMNRNAINLAFPFLTLGLVVGAVLTARPGGAFEWASLKVLGTAGLWVAFLLLLYLRYAVHLAGRRLAVLTIATFALLVATLAAGHPALTGGADG